MPPANRLIILFHYQADDAEDSPSVEYVDDEDSMEADHDVLRYFFQVERLEVRNDGNSDEQIRLPINVRNT